MGTDIHGVFQRRTENGWQDIPHNYDEDRHYTLFAWLGNVRNGRGFAGIPTHNRIEPIAADRGFPSDFDVCEDTHPIESFDVIANWRKQYRTENDELNLWMGDHSHSWASADEILNAKPPRILRTGVIDRELYESWDGKSAPDNWSGGIVGSGILVSNPSEIKKETTHVRIEWFSELAEEFKYFIDEVRRLKELHGEVRFVFGFDN